MGSGVITGYDGKAVRSLKKGTEVQMAGKIESNKKQKKDALLNSAFEIFTNEGFSKSSISDIVKLAGVAKGTFYLYFTDKYDIRNKLVARKAGIVFKRALEAYESAPFTGGLADAIIFIVDNILDQFNENKALLNFISKNLSWGIFKGAITGANADSEVDFDEFFEYLQKITCIERKQLEIILFLVVEFVSSTCYSSILYSEPVPIEELKPYIFSTIKFIVENNTSESTELIGS